MNKPSGKLSKEQKLKSALRDNLKKRKQFARSLSQPEEKAEASSVTLRAREISAREISTKKSK